MYEDMRRTTIDFVFLNDYAKFFAYFFQKIKSKVGSNLIHLNGAWDNYFIDFLITKGWVPPPPKILSFFKFREGRACLVILFNNYQYIPVPNSRCTVYHSPLIRWVVRACIYWLYIIIPIITHSKGRHHK